MNKRRVEKMILEAIDILAEDRFKDLFDTSTGKKCLKSNFNGYISSFAPCVVQAGLLQTLMFFTRQDGEGQDRKRIVDLMGEVLAKTGLIKEDKKKINLRSIVEKRLRNAKTAQKRAQLKTLILEASTAVKLAMRTFPKSKLGDG